MLVSILLPQELFIVLQFYTKNQFAIEPCSICTPSASYPHCSPWSRAEKLMNNVLVDFLRARVKITSTMLADPPPPHHPIYLFWYQKSEIQMDRWMSSIQDPPADNYSRWNKRMKARPMRNSDWGSRTPSAHTHIVAAVFRTLRTTYLCFGVQCK
jgi:hypothetical protein